MIHLSLGTSAEPVSFLSLLLSPFPPFLSFPYLILFTSNCNLCIIAKKVLLISLTSFLFICHSFVKEDNFYITPQEKAKSQTLLLTLRQMVEFIAPYFFESVATQSQHVVFSVMGWRTA